MSFSATVYSFATTLACFLFGIFLGSRLASKVVDEHEDPVALFAYLELGTGVALGALGLVLHAVPDLFGRLLVLVATVLGDGREHALVVATLLASFPLLLVPATLLGATFPVALRIYTLDVTVVPMDAERQLVHVVLADADGARRSQRLNDRRIGTGCRCITEQPGPAGRAHSGDVDVVLHREETGAQLAVGGEAHAVAALAEGRAHRIDKADLASLAIGENPVS